MGLYHHSRLLKFRNPQGAVTCGSTVSISAELTCQTTVREILLHTWNASDGDAFLPMSVSGNSARIDIRVPEFPCLFYYNFLLTYPDGYRQYYGAGSGEGVLSDEPGNSYRITVYDASYETPEWFCEGVCYQIFPDRFRRSSWEDFHARLNSHIALGESPRVHDRWSDSPLTSPAPGETDYAPNDFFGGDLYGILQKLDYIASFGVTCIYLNPVFCSSSNHRYNTADYMHVDPLLGGDDALKALVEEAGKRGIRIMLDGVFSHTGSDSIYFNKEQKYGKDTGAYNDKNSPYREWYTFRDDGSYESWWGFETLPNVWEMTPSYVDFIAGENGVLSHWFRYGIRDWRLDVADELPDAFIRILRKRIKANAEDGVLLGEVWDEPTEKTGPEGRRGYVNGDELDSVMNYTFSDAVLDFLNTRIDAYAFNHSMQFQREQYPKPFYLAALNLLGSHDVPRASSVLSGSPKRDELTREEAARYQIKKEDAETGRMRMLPAAVLQTVLPGVPCLYYGDEAGLTGMSDPYNRATYPWGKEDTELLENMRSIFSLRKKCEALRKGKCRMGAVSENGFCCIRYTENSVAIACVNSSTEPFSFRLKQDIFPEGPDGNDVLNLQGDYLTPAGSAFRIGEETEITVPGISYILYYR